MAEIYESENLKNYYAPQKPVDTTPTRSSLSQQVCKLEGWNFACMLKPCSSTYGNFLENSEIVGFPTSEIFGDLTRNDTTVTDTWISW